MQAPVACDLSAFAPLSHVHKQQRLLILEIIRQYFNINIEQAKDMATQYINQQTIYMQLGLLSCYSCFLTLVPPLLI